MPIMAPNTSTYNYKLPNLDIIAIVKNMGTLVTSVKYQLINVLVVVDGELAAVKVVYHFVITVRSAKSTRENTTAIAIR